MSMLTFFMNSYKDFCKNACASMAKLNQGLSLQYSSNASSSGKNVCSYLKSLTTDVSISKSFKLRRPSSIRMQFILSSFIWELKVFIVSFNHAFQLKIPSVIIFKIAYVAIESWTKYVLYFLTHRTLILLWPLPSLNKWIDQCCSLASAGAEIRLQHCIFLGGIW